MYERHPPLVWQVSTRIHAPDTYRVWGEKDSCFWWAVDFVGQNHVFDLQEEQTLYGKIKQKKRRSTFASMPQPLFRQTKMGKYAMEYATSGLLALISNFRSTFSGHASVDNAVRWNRRRNGIRLCFWFLFLSSSLRHRVCTLPVVAQIRVKLEGFDLMYFVRVSVHFTSPTQRLDRWCQRGGVRESTGFVFGAQTTPALVNTVSVSTCCHIPAYTHTATTTRRVISPVWPPGWALRRHLPGRTWLGTWTASDSPSWCPGQRPATTEQGRISIKEEIPKFQSQSTRKCPQVWFATISSSAKLRNIANLACAEHTRRVSVHHGVVISTSIP